MSHFVSLDLRFPHGRKIEIQKFGPRCTLESPVLGPTPDDAEIYPIDTYVRFKLGDFDDFLQAFNKMQFQDCEMPNVGHMGVGDVVVYGHMNEDPDFRMFYTALVLSPEHCKQLTEHSTYDHPAAVLKKNDDGVWSPTYVDDGSSAADQDFLRQMRLRLEITTENALFPDEEM
jgi:pentatricopeptide repeat protein